MRNSPYLLLISLVSAMGGLLFGYDWVVIGGAKPFYEAYFGISGSPVLQGWVMGSAILGCLLGVVTSGTLADRYGRKPLLVAASLVFVAASVGTGFADSLPVLILFRIIGGVGIGMASNLSPMYIAEVSPSVVRGRYVSINQLTIVTGILAAQLVNWLIADTVIPGEDIIASWNGQWGWRWMFWACTVPAVLFFFLLFLIPESPRWMASRMRYDQASSILARIGSTGYAAGELERIKRSVERDSKEKGGFGLLFKGKMAGILITGIVIAIFQQWCGINVIFNYAQEIFAGAGYDVSDILFNIVITGVTNVVFTFVGMYTVDRMGRRSLLLFGALGLASIYCILGFCYYFALSGTAVLVLVMAGIACYAMTLAPVTWVVISEIFPTKTRAMAMAVSTFSLWTACFILTYTFPLLNAGLGPSGTFWLYGLICVAGFIFVKIRLPETRGKSLEEIEQELTR